MVQDIPNQSVRTCKTKTKQKVSIDWKLKKTPKTKFRRVKQKQILFQLSP